MSDISPRTLAGKTAIITGAATGIGRATALSFARAGAALALADLRGDDLERTAAELSSAGGQAVSPRSAASSGHPAQS